MDVVIVVVVGYKGEFGDYFEFQGIFSHSGHSYKCNTPDEIKELAKEEARATGSFGKKLRSLGYVVNNISIGSTPVCSHLPNDLASNYGITEIHPGNYTLYDLTQMDLGNCCFIKIKFNYIISKAADFQI